MFSMRGLGVNMGKGFAGSGAVKLVRWGGVPWEPVQEAQGQWSRKNSLVNRLVWPSAQSMVMPFDLETAMWSGSVKDAGMALGK